MDNQTLEPEVAQGLSEQSFIVSFKEIQKQVNQTAHDKGWYDSGLKSLMDKTFTEFDGSHMAPDEINELQNLEDCRRIALIHSEISEALENIRHGFAPDDKIPEFSGVEAELADAIIRIMDVAEERGWRVAEALVTKAQYNRSRTYRHGNKTC